MRSRLTTLPRFAKVFILLGTDGIIGSIALWSTAYLLFSGIPDLPSLHIMVAAIAAVVLVPLTGIAVGIYPPVIRFGIPRLSVRVALLSFICGSVFALIGWIGGANPAKAISFGIVFALVLFAVQILSRQVARWFLGDHHANGGKHVAIYGAGAAGRQLVTLIRGTGDFSPVLFIDDDASLHFRTVEDLLVVGSQDQKLADRLRSKRVQEIFLAIPSLKAGRRREILERLAHLPYRVRIVPGLAELVTGQSSSISDVRDVSIEDLLGRDSVAPLADLLDRCVKGKTLLISGGGGSIGSELCRQALALRPARLVVLEHSEFALYQIEQALRTAEATAGTRTPLHFILGSVTDPLKIAEIFGQFRIDTVYHTAAYKHVPIVEMNPLEGFRNNVLGTWFMARAAAQAGVRHFVLVSSDKAVRPTNIMGATKRMAELVVQALAKNNPATVFSMVRFGNVLESSGSVVPLFRQQIASGGPVTLTHSEVTRYFMSIAEAVQLVIQAGAIANGGEVFVLDMGDPVKIKDLAMRMIRLSGRSVRDQQNPGGDIAIAMVGLRPGEKLFEELLLTGEAVGTVHPRIFQVREGSVDGAQLEHEIQQLQNSAWNAPASLNVQKILARWADGFTPRETGTQGQYPVGLRKAPESEPRPSPSLKLVN